MIVKMKESGGIWEIVDIKENVKQGSKLTIEKYQIDGGKP